MDIDRFLPGGLVDSASIVRRAEDAGFGTLGAGEMAHDPMLPAEVAP